MSSLFSLASMVPEAFSRVLSPAAGLFTPRDILKPERTTAASSNRLICVARMALPLPMLWPPG